jgi:hypothetical protein
VLQLLLDSAVALSLHQAAVFSNQPSNQLQTQSERDRRQKWLDDAPRITKGAMALMPQVKFAGRLVVVTRPEQVKEEQERESVRKARVCVYVCVSLCVCVRVRVRVRVRFRVSICVDLDLNLHKA